MKKYIFMITILIGCISQPQAFAQDSYDPTSSVIENDIWWFDDKNDTIFASMGGHITKFDDTYYWVGSDPRKDLKGYDIRLYSSKTLGSNSWKFETLIDDRPAGMDGRTNCTLIYNALTDRYVLVTKGINFYQSQTNDVKGSYNYIRKVKVAEEFGHPEYETGGMSAYYEGNDAYIIVSNKLIGGRTRYCGIWRLTSDFLNVEEEILWLKTARNREAYWLFKKDNKYYMTYDGAGGWKASDCYYRTSDALAGTWSIEKDILMDPEPANNLMRSHASQSRWMMNIDGQWMYGGDRYPFQEPESHPPAKGSFVWCPVVWDGETPTVKFEPSWSVSNYSLGVDDISIKNQKLLVQNFPNPFSEKTTINYNIPINTGLNDKVTLNIFNLRGQLINQLINQYKAPGQYTIEWDGSTANGYKVSSGLYIAEMTVGTQKNNIKLLYSKDK